MNCSMYWSVIAHLWNEVTVGDLILAGLSTYLNLVWAQPPTCLASCSCVGRTVQRCQVMSAKQTHVSPTRAQIGVHYTFTQIGVRDDVCGLCGVVGLRWWAGASRLCVCLRWFPALVPVCVYLPDYLVSLEHTQIGMLWSDACVVCWNPLSQRCTDRGDSRGSFSVMGTYR